MALVAAVDTDGPMPAGRAGSRHRGRLGHDVQRIDLGFDTFDYQSTGGKRDPFGHDSRFPFGMLLTVRLKCISIESEPTLNAD
jgi:hypothetical protein